jgi:hypothetical protein
MPRIKTLTVVCDVCQKEFPILDDKETPGAEEILHIMDALGKEFFFCNTTCLQKWLSKYKCPYLASKGQTGDIDEILPGVIN